MTTQPMSPDAASDLTHKWAYRGAVLARHLVAYCDRLNTGHVEPGPPTAYAIDLGQILRGEWEPPPVDDQP